VCEIDFITAPFFQPTQCMVHANTMVLNYFNEIKFAYHCFERGIRIENDSNQIKNGATSENVPAAAAAAVVVNQSLF
jgi:hypothetical protein